MIIIMVLNTIKKTLESYVNVYIPKKQEKFAETAQNSAFSIITTIIWWLVLGFAIYLSFRCNNKFMLGDFLLALFCAPCYVLYHLATSGLCGLI